MRKLLAIIVLCLLMLALWLGWALYDPVKPEQQIFLTIKYGSNARQIASALDKAGLIRSRSAFLIYHALTGRRGLKAGDYSFDISATTPVIYERLVRGDVYVRAIIIPEGFNIFDIADVMADAKLCTRKDFLAAARSDTALIKDLSPNAPSLEGFLFPDTYYFPPRSATAHDLTAAMVKRFRQEAHSLGLTADFQRTVTLASIVEKETRIPAERPLVASVFENRLKLKMGLATDPSIIYAAQLADKWSGVIHVSDLHRDSPYNTYKHNGLPPGPIANPGRAALAAAMHPAQSQFLYFVADNTGGHNFARTKQEHDRNVAAYRKGVAHHLDR